MAPRREAIVRNVQLADRLLGSFIGMTCAEEAPLRGPLDLTAMLHPLAATDPTLQLSLPGTPLWLAAAHALISVQRTAQRHGGELILQDVKPGLCATLRLPLSHPPA